MVKEYVSVTMNRLQVKKISIYLYIYRTCNFEKRFNHNEHVEVIGFSEW